MHFAGPGRPVLWEALHTRDDTFVVNQERTFQARKRDARESELLVGIERAGSVVAEPLHPIPVPEQDWLYRGRPLRRIVAGLGLRCDRNRRGGAVQHQRGAEQGQASPTASRLRDKARTWSSMAANRPVEKTDDARPHFQKW